MCTLDCWLHLVYFNVSLRFQKPFVARQAKERNAICCSPRSVALSEEKLIMPVEKERRLI